MRTTSDVFTLHICFNPYSRGNEVIENVCVGMRAAPGQHKEDRNKREGYVTSWLQGSQCKTSNHSSARELEPLSKDLLKALNCLIAVDGCDRQPMTIVRVWLLLPITLFLSAFCTPGDEHSLRPQGVWAIQYRRWAGGWWGLGNLWTQRQHAQITHS